MEAKCITCANIKHTFKIPLDGVHLLIPKKGPLIVDINAFPGLRDVLAASTILVDLLERLSHTQGECFAIQRCDSARSSLE